MFERIQRAWARSLGAELHHAHVSKGRLAAWRLDGMGEGPPVVLIHGLGAEGTAYINLAERLRPVVSELWMPDLPGHGHSRPWHTLTTRALVQGVTEGLHQLLDRPAVLHGNSLGGYTALWVASTIPDQVAGVLVTSPGGGALPEGLRAELLQRFQPRTHADAVDLVDRSVPDLDPITRHAVAVAARRMLNQDHVRALVESVRPEDEFSPEQMRRLTMPVRVLWGTAERALHPLQREWFRRHLPPHAELLEPDGWGHTASANHSDELCDELIAFLRARQAGALPAYSRLRVDPEHGAQRGLAAGFPPQAASD